MQKAEERLYCEQTRILYEANETLRHENDNHVYLMIALQVEDDDDPYYKY
jgi:hypothetical protein